MNVIMRKKGIYLLLSVVILFFGCKKVIEPEPITVDGIVTVVFPPQEDSLTSFFASWILEVTVNGNSVFYTPLYDAPSPWSPNYEVSLTLEAGSDRIFTVYGLDPSLSILWWAQKRVDLLPKEEFDVGLSMIPAGEGSASHIVVFRDDLSWNANTIEEVLQEEGLTYGSDSNQYEIKGSGDFSSILSILDPETDMMIIAADQEQSFYDNYRANQGDIEEFVKRGGGLFFEAVDRGFHNGSISDAGIVFPGVVELDPQYSYEDYNTVFNLHYSLTQGIPRPDSVHGNLASHGTFLFLWPVSQTFTRGTTSGDETLVLYPYSAGWVMLSTQPLEFNYAMRRGQHDDRKYAIGLLLPRILRLFLGRPLT